MPWFILLLALDQATKYFFGLQGRVEINRGLSFGWGEGMAVWFLILILAIFGWWLKKQALPRWFWILFFAGVISNLFDRWFFGGVRDWLTIPFTGLMNNLADWYIFIAVGYYVLEYLYEHRNFIRRR